jgi:hypothetical protein
MNCSFINTLFLNLLEFRVFAELLVVVGLLHQLLLPPTAPRAAGRTARRTGGL